MNIQQKYPAGFLYKLELKQSLPQKEIFLLAQNGYGDLYKSIDLGETWEEYSHVGIGPWYGTHRMIRHKDTIYTLGNGVRISTDKGHTWDQISTELIQEACPFGDYVLFTNTHGELYINNGNNIEFYTQAPVDDWEKTYTVFTHDSNIYVGNKPYGFSQYINNTWTNFYSGPDTCCACFICKLGDTFYAVVNRSHDTGELTGNVIGGIEETIHEYFAELFSSTNGISWSYVSNITHTTERPYIYFREPTVDMIKIENNLFLTATIGHMGSYENDIPVLFHSSDSGLTWNRIYEGLDYDTYNKSGLYKTPDNKILVGDIDKIVKIQNFDGTFPNMVDMPWGRIHSIIDVEI